MIENPGTSMERSRERSEGWTRSDFLLALAGIFAAEVLPACDVKVTSQGQQSQEIPYSPPKTPEAKPGVIREKIFEGVFIEFSESERMSNGNKDIEVTIIFSEAEKWGNFFNKFRTEIGAQDSFIKRYFSGIKGNINGFQDNEGFKISFSCNFYESLSYLHQTKGSIVADSNTWKEVSTRILNWYKNNPPNRISIEKFKEILSQIINKVKESLKNEFSNDNYINFFFSNLDPNILISLSLREILPNPKSDEEYLYSLILFNIFLNVAGTQFIEGIPALHDNFVSFGPFQFTSLPVGGIVKSYSVYFDDKKFKEIMKTVFGREIEFVNDIKYLDNGMHYIWFIINALRIFMGILMSLNNDEQKEKFINLLSNKENFVKFVALSHFLPQTALEIVVQSLQGDSIDWESLNKSKSDFKKLAYDYIADIYKYYSLISR
jgi:CRISPR/Cas system CSM-associated protein Csm2 small subunit